MKNILLSTILFLSALLPACAQEQATDNTFCFLDADGNALTDGASVWVNVEEDDWGMLSGDSQLRVLNTTDAKQGVSAITEVTSLPSGSFQLCFPSVCETYSATGSYTHVSGTVLASKKPKLNAEFLPAENGYGTCTVTVQLLHVALDSDGAATDEIKGYGPKVTINYVYTSPDGVEGVTADKAPKVVARYNAAGQTLTAPCRGLNIVKMSDGTTRKVVIR